VTDKITTLAENIYICRSGSVRKICTLVGLSLVSFGCSLSTIFSQHNIRLRVVHQTIVFSRLHLSFSQAADTQALSSYITYFLHQHRIEYDGLPEVKTAAMLAKQLAYDNKVRFLRLCCVLANIGI
jgi:hypothetical protein